MQVTNSNNVKIYNLSSGKSLPDWISERKRRLLQKKDIGVRQRIELIQDFEMPGVSNNIKVSPDGKFIFATGIYKPRIRCYDVDNLSMKFERCFDAEAVQFEILSDDYSKFVILQCDRSLEFHVRYGMCYKTRIPKFGRDLAYHPESGDLLIVGASSEIYRLNLEQGRFLSSYQTEASSINKVIVHPGYDIIACGTMEGKVEAWDPRMREKIGVLDCALNCMTENTVVEGFPSVTSLYFKEGKTISVGTFTGQVLLYDIRTNKPFLVKDHMYGLPIKNIDFVNEELVVSVDPKCVKFWDKNNGKPYTTIQAPAHLNDLCVVPNSGLLFLANEDKKISTYFLPSLGPAPKWCSFLDSITEELEESKNETVYDDYKFVTKKELEELRLDHLLGTNVLRAYMHGYFMDIRLYNKAKAMIQPTAYKDLKKKMVHDKIEKGRKADEIVIKKLPNVNKALAEKLLVSKNKEKQMAGKSLLEDSRFTSMFEDPIYEANEADEIFTHQKFEQKNKKKPAVVSESEQMDILEEERSKKYEEYTSEDDDDDDEDDDDDDDDEEESASDDSQPETGMALKKPKNMFEAVDSERFSMLKKDDDNEDNLVPIGERLKNTNMTIKHGESSGGNKIVTFTVKKHDEKVKKRDEERKAHLKERAKYRRSTKYLRK